MKKLDQNVFNGVDPRLNVAVVDYDGTLKFGEYICDKTWLRYTWAAETWRGIDWEIIANNSGYEPLTKLFREGTKTWRKSTDFLTHCLEIVQNV